MSTIFWTIPGGSVKNLNKHTILDRVRFTPGGISRVELSRQLHLTRAAVTTLVNDLEQARLIREVAGQSGGGRKPIVLEVRPDIGCVLGVDMGATHLTILLADSSAKVMREWEEPIDITRGPQVCLDHADRVIRQMLHESSLSLKQIRAVGLGVPGPVISETGRVSGPPIMPGWDNFPIRDSLIKRWDCPVTVSNDAELGALGEWAYGAARGETNLAYIKVGMGIGAGLLLNGLIYQGVSGAAGEIGHTTLNENGPLCLCGNRGCLEAFAGSRAVAQRAITSLKQGQRSRLSEIVPMESITAQDVLSAARRGDLLSQQILAETGAHLGTAVASLVNLFNPGMVVIGGNVAQIGDLLLEPIRQAVQQRSLRAASQHVRITSALLGRRSSGMGAVVQALSVFLHRLAAEGEGNPK